MTDFHLSLPLPAKGGWGGDRLPAEQRWPELTARTAKLKAVLFCTEHPGKSDAWAALLPSVEFLQHTGYL